MKVASELIAALCGKHAPEVLTPVQWQGTPLDKVRLLWGIAGVESSFGVRSNPHHDKSYCVGGRHFSPELTSQWGCLAHCSFGPWQVEFPNFKAGISPLSLMWAEDGRVAAEVCLLGALDVLNRAIARGASGIHDIVLHYNGPEYVDQYAAELATCMDRPMPVPSAETVA